MSNFDNRGKTTMSALRPSFEMDSDTAQSSDSPHATSGVNAFATRSDVDPILPSSQQEAAETNGSANRIGDIFTEEDDCWRQKSILSFDGGGIRGYASLLLLQALMVCIGEEEQTYKDTYKDIHSTSFRPFEQPPMPHLRGTGFVPGAYNIQYFPCHYFDYIAGTSTGGLIATMLSRWRMSVAECLVQYRVFGRDIFAEKRLSLFGYPRCKHSKKPLIMAAKQLADQRIARIEGQPVRSECYRFPSPPGLCRTIVVAIRKGSTTRTPHESTLRSYPTDGPFLFRSYNNTESDRVPPALNFGVDINHEIWEVCRATTAAKWYFDPQRIGDDEYADGGAGVNNPTMKVYREVNSMHENDVKTVVSFGTGKPEPYSLFKEKKKLYILHPRSAVKDIYSALGTLKAHLTECEVTHSDVEWCAGGAQNGLAAFRYFRFNVNDRLGKVKLNEWKERRDDGRGGQCSTLEYIEWCTEQELEKEPVREELRRLARILVDRRRRRTQNDRDRWERFACCTSYECHEDACRQEGEGGPRTDLYRRDMKAHLRQTHNCPPQAINSELDKSRREPDFPGGPF